MKKAFLLLCTLLLVLGSLLPLAGYRLTKAVLGEAAASSEVPASSALPAPGGSLPGTDTGSPETGRVHRRRRGLPHRGPEHRGGPAGAAAGLSHRRSGSGKPISWPDEALKAQAVAAHSYVLYCRDHAHSRQRSLGSPPTPHGGRAT